MGDTQDPFNKFLLFFLSLEKVSVTATRVPLFLSFKTPLQLPVTLEGL